MVSTGSSLTSASGFSIASVSSLFSTSISDSDLTSSAASSSFFVIWLGTEISFLGFTSTISDFCETFCSVKR